MAEVNWDAIKTEYLTTDTSYRKLAKKHGVSQQTLTHRAIKEKWVEQRQRYKSKVEAKTLAKAEQKASDYKSELYEIAFAMAAKLRETAENHTVDELLSIGLKPRDITGALKDIGDVLHVKSDADLREQEARIANLKKQADTADANKEIKVTISGDIEEYAK